MPTKKETFGLAVCDGVRMSHPPGAVFQARLLDNGANGAIPNDTASEKSRRYVSNVDLFLVPTLFQLFQLFQLLIQVCGVIYTVLYGAQCLSIRCGLYLVLDSIREILTVAHRTVDV